jgi:hypothetical protein
MVGPWLQHCRIGLAAVEGLIVDLKAEMVSEQVDEPRIVLRVVVLNAQQIAVVVGGEKAPAAEGGGMRPGPKLGADRRAAPSALRSALRWMIQLSCNARRSGSGMPIS